SRAKCRVAAHALDEGVEERGAEGERLSRSRVDGGPQRVDVHTGLLDLGRMPRDPELPEVGRRLGVELDAPRLGAVDPEGLVANRIAAREDPRVGWGLEHVVVPLADPGPAVEELEDRIVTRLVGRADV